MEWRERERERVGLDLRVHRELYIYRSMDS